MSHGRAYFRAVFFSAIFLMAVSSLAWGQCGAVLSNSVTCMNNAAVTGSGKYQREYVSFDSQHTQQHADMERHEDLRALFSCRGIRAALRSQLGGNNV